MNKLSDVLLYLYDRNLVKKICEKHGLSPMEAFRSFVSSDTYRMLCDKRYMMHQFSYDAIFDIWENEFLTGDPRNSIYISGE